MLHVRNYQKLTTVHVVKGNPSYFSSNGALYDSRTKDIQFVFYPQQKTDVNYTIAEGTISIPVLTLSNTYLKKLIIAKLRVA